MLFEQVSTNKKSNGKRKRGKKVSSDQNWPPQKNAGQEKTAVFGVTAKIGASWCGGKVKGRGERNR